MAANTWTVCLYLLSALLAFLSLVASGTVHYFSWYDSSVDTGMFDANQTFYWGRYDQCLTVPSWIFYVGAGVWLTQLVWIFYAVTLVCHQTNGYNLISNPPVLPFSITFFFAVAMLCTVAWLFLWVRDDWVKFSTIMMFLATLFAFVILFMVVYKLHVHHLRMLQLDFTCAVWVIRILVFNSLGALATFLGTLLSYTLAAVAIQDGGASHGTSCYIHLGIMAAFTIMFFVFDILTCMMTLWTFLAPYIILLLFQCAMIVQNVAGETADRDIVMILAGILVGMTTTMMMVRQGWSAWRHKMGAVDGVYTTRSFKWNNAASRPVARENVYSITNVASSKPDYTVTKPITMGAGSSLRLTGSRDHSPRPINRIAHRDFSGHSATVQHRM